ncbi:MAG: phosphopantothenate/pantothenate synthetase [Nitrososphaera sp.]|nr:phosphopantothenate/pantothenate synthetase [Nitrososphaera sp.]
MTIPPEHPRAKSLYTREALVDGFRRGLVAAEGLIAHGRGEAFDYLIGEKTTRSARMAIRAAAALLLISKHPVISVNGNVAALSSREVVDLAKVTDAEIEVNLFYRTRERELAIKAQLERYGARNILGVGPAASSAIPELRSERRRVDPAGILEADTVFVPLEDGDRTEALVRMGKKVITVDLNPLSRTAKAAHVTIVDNIIRSLPALVESARSLKGNNSLKRVYDSFDNRKNLQKSLAIIRGAV